MTTHVALVRGINVGGAARVPMDDLRGAVADAGGTDVRTLLNSGNALFTARGIPEAALASRIAGALDTRVGFRPAVMVAAAARLAAAAAGNPLAIPGRDPSRLLAGFVSDADNLDRVRPLLDTDWSPEALALGPDVVYLWCPAGVTASVVAKAVGRALGDGVTMRNWATVLKLAALAGS